MPPSRAKFPAYFPIPDIVDDKDSDEEYVLRAGYGNLSLALQLGSLSPKRRYQINRWHAGADRRTRARLRITRVRWAFLAYASLRRQYLRRVSLIQIMNQQYRLSFVRAFEKFFMRVLNKHFQKLPVRMQTLIAEFLG